MPRPSAETGRSVLKMAGHEQRRQAPMEIYQITVETLDGRTYVLCWCIECQAFELHDRPHNHDGHHDR